MDLVKSLTVCCRIPKERERERERERESVFVHPWLGSEGVPCRKCLQDDTLLQGWPGLSHTLIAPITSLMACLPVIIAHYLIIWIMSRPLDCKSCERGDCLFFAHFGIPRIFNGVSSKSSQKWPLIQWMSGIEEVVGIGVEKKSSRWRKPFERGPCRNGPLSILRDYKH